MDTYRYPETLLVATARGGIAIGIEWTEVRNTITFYDAQHCFPQQRLTELKMSKMSMSRNPALGNKM